MATAYDDIGRLYRTRRRPDPRIAAQILAALGDATSVVNVGAGSGSYEPSDRRVVAVEPSTVMLRQRASDAAPAVQGVAEALPLPDHSVDAALAVLTIHHWSDKARGLAELTRVSRRQVVFGFDLEVNHAHWLVQEYLPEIVPIEERRVADPAWIAAQLGGDTRIEVITVPADCTDGFQNAYWRRPEMYFEPDVQACISTLAVLDQAVLDRGLGRLADDLASGAWHARHADLLTLDEIDVGYRLVVADQG
jgi:SAM-dependent methyltransferase